MGDEITVEAKAALEAVELRQAMVEMREAADSLVQECTKTIKAFMEGMGAEFLHTDQWTAKRIVQTRETLSKTKLVEAGVSLLQIKAATTTSEVVMLRVDPRKPEGA